MPLRKLPRFDAKLVTEKFFPKDVETPSDINSGRCFAWAYTAYKLFQEVEIWDIQGRWSHAFVYVRNTKKYYDAETTNGVTDWKQLPAAKFCASNKASHRKLLSFLHDWKDSATYHSISWYGLDRKIKKILSQYAHPET